MREFSFKILEDFIKKESTSGILLIFSTIVALLFSNTQLISLYNGFRYVPVEIRLGDLYLAKPLFHWVNDGLMAIFFLLIGLEVKREILEGHLSSPAQIALPGIAALGGMAIPALVYVAFNYNNPEALDGWAIPAATDIAFALGILSLVNDKIPLSLKTFLMSLAIIDDLGAIIIIALFYTSELSMLSIIIASISLVALIVVNRLGITKKAAYFVLGTILWVSVLKSGVHATLAGVALAFTIPLKSKDNRSLAKEIEHDLHFWVAFFILPLFAFVNAGVNLEKIDPARLFEPLSLGIILGLFLGKQIGVFAFSWLAIKLGIARLPRDASWLQFYGVSVLTGIGFTMSLFISSLAFPDPKTFQYLDKAAILIGSFLSGMMGFLILKYAKPV